MKKKQQYEETDKDSIQNHGLAKAQDTKTEVFVTDTNNDMDNKQESTQEIREILQEPAMRYTEGCKTEKQQRKSGKYSRSYEQQCMVQSPQH